jgi:hypothetical protein
VPRLSSHLVHELTLPNGTDRVRICLQVGKKGGTLFRGITAKGVGVLREERAAGHVATNPEKKICGGRSLL